MKMNKIYKSLGLLLALSLFSSCYKDHSVNGDHPLAVVEVAEPIASVQTATFGEVTVIKSPAYTITTGASVTPSYEWIVDGVVVSTEKDLSYSPTSYGKHDARLRMYTPDGSYFYRFTIDVPYRYVDGLYVLASNEGKTILSYLPGGEKTDAFDLDAFGRSNPTIDMTGDPQSMVIYRYVPGAGASRSYLGIALGLPTRYYRVSADYRSANGIDLYSGREEYGARVALNHTTKGGLITFSLNVAPRIAYRKNASWDVFRNAVEANPTTPIMDPKDPSLYYNFKGQAAGYNPLELLKKDKSTGTTKLLDWDGTMKLNLLPLLLNKEDRQTLTTQLTFADHQYDNYNQWFRPSTSTLAINAGREGEASQDYSKSAIRTLEWVTNYANSFGNHNFKVMAGYSYQYEQYSGLNAANKDFPNDALEDNNLGSGTYAKDEGELGMGSYKNDSKLISFFGRVSYDWKGRYMLTASLRHEGSSKFGEHHKWGNFPAISAGWRISDEAFMAGTKSWLTDLKLRGDFGITGNQSFDSYRSLNTMSGFGYYLYNGKYYQVWGPGKNVNPDLRWEKGQNWNVGLDWTLFGGDLYGSFNYYSRKQQDLLGDYNVSVPPYLFTSTFVNVGTMRNSGFEFDLTWNAVKTKDFTYTINVIGATMSNKFVDFSNDKFVGQDYYDVVGTEDPYPFHNLQRIEKGKRIGNFYMLKYAGVDPQGRWIVYDKDGDKVLADNATDDDRQYVGNGLPQFTGSMTHTLRYKNIDASLFFQTALGFDLFNIHDFYYGTRNFQGNVMDKAYSKNKIVSQNPIVSDYFLEPGDYLKLSSVSLGYTLNLKKKYIDAVRIYATASNLFTITKFSGIDPSNYQVNGLNPGATGSRSYYPSTRQFMIGTQVNF